MLKRVAIGIVAIFILLVLAGNLLQVVDPEGVRQRAAEAPAPTATARLVLPTPTSFPTRAPTATSAPTPVPSPKIGDDARIEVESLERLPLAVDEQAMDDLSKASTARDNIGLLEILASGRAFRVAVGTRVRVIDQSIETSRVRILEGPEVGRAGWLLTRNLKPITP